MSNNTYNTIHNNFMATMQLKSFFNHLLLTKFLQFFVKRVGGRFFFHRWPTLAVGAEDVWSSLFRCDAVDGIVSSTQLVVVLRRGYDYYDNINLFMLS